MGVLVWCFFGAIAGYCARSVMPGPSAGALSAPVALGVGSALIGGAIGTGVSQRSAFFEVDFLSFCLATSATLVVLLGYRGYALRLQD